MVTEKNNFSSNAWHNFAKDKIISKCKNDKPWRKVKQIYSPPPLKRGGGSELCIYTTFVQLSLQAPLGDVLAGVLRKMEPGKIGLKKKTAVKCTWINVQEYSHSFFTYFLGPSQTPTKTLFAKIINGLKPASLLYIPLSYIWQNLRYTSTYYTFL